jgi:tetratricopeptide (TPR) repeat protein
MNKLVISIIIILFSVFSFAQDPTVDRHLHKGIDAFNNQDHETALKHLEKELHYNPKEAQAYYYIGLIKNAKDLNDGCADFSIAIELNPDFDEAYKSRSECKVYKGDFKGALEDLNKAIEIDSSNAVYYFNRSEIRVTLKDYQGGLKDAGKALKLDPMLPPTIFGTIAKAYAGLGNYKDALKFASEFIQFEQYPSSYLVRADIKFATKDYTGALEDYQKANDPDIDGGNTYVKIALTKFALDDSNGACKAIEKAIVLGVKIDEELLKKCGK